MKRLATGVQRRVFDLSVRLRVRPYRRHWVLSAQDWDRAYQAGECDYYGSLAEQGRYGTLAGYLAARPPGARLLDLGCGTGIFEQRTRHLELKEYVGLDPSETAIAQARAEAAPRARFEVAERPDPALGRFDVIVCNEMLYYVEDLPGLLRQLRSALTPDGWLLTSIVRHPGDIALHRTLAEHFRLIDALDVQRQTRPRNGWRIACYGVAQAA